MHGSGVGFQANPEICWITRSESSTGLGSNESPIASAIGLITQDIVEGQSPSTVRQGGRTVLLYSRTLPKVHTRLLGKIYF